MAAQRTNSCSLTGEGAASSPRGIDLFALAGAGNVAAVDPRADRGQVSFPVDSLDVGVLRLIPARRWICEGVVKPASAEAAYDTMLFLVVVVAKASIRSPKDDPFLDRAGGKTKSRA